ncbi:hypothetical protein ACVPOQ_04360 [Staphylococcus aureus]
MMMRCNGVLLWKLGVMPCYFDVLLWKLGVDAMLLLMCWCYDAT